MSPWARAGPGGCRTERGRESRGAGGGQPLAPGHPVPGRLLRREAAFSLPREEAPSRGLAPPSPLPFALGSPDSGRRQRGAPRTPVPVPRSAQGPRALAERDACGEGVCARASGLPQTRRVWTGGRGGMGAATPWAAARSPEAHGQAEREPHPPAGAARAGGAFRIAGLAPSARSAPAVRLHLPWERGPPVRLSCLPDLAGETEPGL